MGVCDPADAALLESLRQFHHGQVSFSWIDRGELTGYLGSLLARDGSASGHAPASGENLALDKLANDAPVINLVNSIISEAIRREASDIHIEGFTERMVVRYRLDGILQTVRELERERFPAVATRIKIMANLNIMERRRPQDGRITVHLGDDRVDMRVSAIPIAGGESFVLRLFAGKRAPLALEQLGLDPAGLEELMGMAGRPNGLILINGPTGSGKTTTLNALLERIRSDAKKIITIEDPIEYVIDGVAQIQTNERIGLGFDTLLRRVLRQDPNIIMVGEIRDTQTAELAVRAALTGHLVLSTLHTRDAVSVIPRLKNMQIEPYLIAAVLRGSVAQRLVRRLCPVLPSRAGADGCRDSAARAPRSSGRAAVRGPGLQGLSPDGIQGSGRDLRAFQLRRGDRGDDRLGPAGCGDPSPPAVPRHDASPGRRIRQGSPGSDDPPGAGKGGGRLMASYECRVIDTRGHARTMVREAASEELLLRELNREELSPLRIRAAAVAGAAGGSRRRFSRAAVLEFTDSVGLLLSSGLTFKDSLEVAQGIFLKGEIAAMVTHLLGQIRKGGTVADAIAGLGTGLPPIYRGFIRIGERTGSLEEAFKQLAAYLAEDKRLRDRISGSLTYPVLVLGAAVVGIVGIVTFVLPRVRLLFEQLGTALPARLSAMLGVVRTAGIAAGVLLAAGAVAVILLAVLRRGNPRLAERLDRIVLGLPLVGRMRFLREMLNLLFAMEMLTAGGFTVEDALAQTAEVTSNRALRAALGTGPRGGRARGQSLLGLPGRGGVHLARGQVDRRGGAGRAGRPGLRAAAAVLPGGDREMVHPVHEPRGTRPDPGGRGDHPRRHHRDRHAHLLHLRGAGMRRKAVRTSTASDRRQAGFTFIEIMVAMMILVILIGAAGFTYVRYIARARVVGARNQIEILSIALSSYYLDAGRYPTSEQGLAALWEKPLLEPVPAAWNGPYLNKRLPADPWGHAYEYTTPGPNGLPFGLRSFGADGAEGGEGNDADVTSWSET